ncbi:FecR family protein [Winogradskyella sp. PE311]|uniref:FecR family protein n=1 Tax=Winogradskyella sp. PE311 TaxID=3366943 RepID=UPI00397E93BE
MKKEISHNQLDTFLAKWLEGELTDKELKDLVDEQDYIAFLKLRKGLYVKECLDAPIELSFAKIQEKITKKTKKSIPLYKNWSFAIAASIALIFGLFMFLNETETIIQTGFGEQKTIALLDGSEVILNSNSKITYNEDNWEENRKLNLDGEAYFKVAKGKKFDVNTNNGTVTVLGTQFNINSTKDFFDVVCYEGKVGVKTKQSDYILLQNDALRRVNGYSITTSQNEEKLPAWIYGESTFKSVPLKFVIKALENQYNIRFDSNDINDTDVFTGSFPHDSLNIALKTVFRPLNIKYIEEEKRNIKLRY